MSYTPFGEPQRLPEMVKATATLCEQQKSALKIPPKFIAVSHSVWNYGITCKTSGRPQKTEIITKYMVSAKNALPVKES